MAHQTILTNVRVLAIGQNVQEENGKKVVVGGNATLELDPKQAELDRLRAEHRRARNLHLVLRSLVDSGGATETVNDPSEAQVRRPDHRALRRGAASGPLRRLRMNRNIAKAGAMAKRTRLVDGAGGAARRSPRLPPRPPRRAPTIRCRRRRSRSSAARSRACNSASAAR